MSSQESQQTANVLYHSMPEFAFANGVILQNVKVAYRSINSGSNKGVVLIPTCFGGRINSTLNFTQSPVDALAEYHVVVAAMLGNGESASPSNTSQFPEPGQLHYEDVIHAHHHLLTHALGVKELRAVIGFSMGGQEAYHWAVLYPQFVRSIVGICTSARTSPHNYTFLEGPIAALENSVDYVSWKQEQTKQAANRTPAGSLHEAMPTRGLSAFGRAYVAWLTSAEWFRSQRWREMGAPSLDAWLKGASEADAEWNPDDILVLARMWQMADIGKAANGKISQLSWDNPSDDDLQAALGSINCPVLLMPSRSDQYFRPSESEFEMKYLKSGKLEVIESDCGHLAGAGISPEDAAFMNRNLDTFLNEVPVSS